MEMEERVNLRVSLNIGMSEYITEEIIDVVFDTIADLEKTYCDNIAIVGTVTNQNIKKGNKRLANRIQEILDSVDGTGIIYRNVV